MAKHYISFTFALICFTNPCLFYGQATPSQYESSWRQLQEIRNLLNTQIKDQPIAYKDIKGSPYENETFQLGSFYINDSLIGDFPMRYNTYSDQLEVLSNEKNATSEGPNYDAFLKLNNSKFIINSTTYQLLNWTDDNNILEKKYFKLLVKHQNNQLYERKYSVLTPASKAQNFNQSDRAARFSTYTEYYLKQDEKAVFITIPQSKKKLIQLFPNIEKEMKLFIKEHKLDIKSSQDLIKLINYSNSI